MGANIEPATSFVTPAKPASVAVVIAAWHYSANARRMGLHYDQPAQRYVGITSDLARRAWEHREGAVEGFTKKYGLKRLIFAERHDDIRAAIQREKNLKHWPRARKVRLILAENPTWEDLYDKLA